METESSKSYTPSDKFTKDLDQFFANGLYNSTEATDELIKYLEKSQNETLAKKALALYQGYYASLERPWDHVNFMYGLGLIYMHFNAYNLAIKAFRETIYVQPSFARSRDIHTRLGLIFKANGRYKLSEKHFRLAINDTRPNCGTSTRLELEFYLAHLFEVQGKVKQAKEAYERLLRENDLPHQLSANIHRQLGLLYFQNDFNDATDRNIDRHQHVFNQQNSLSNSRIDAALNYLNTSYQTDCDPKTSYYLGRCYTDAGKFQEAFESYKGVLNKECTADSWCSIGVLYHRQNQPMDALQAFIRAVQFDRKHSTAWMNLGSIYESYNQFHDALKCYQHVLRSQSSEASKTLQARIKYIQKQISDIESSTSNNGKLKIISDKLISLEDLWNLESKNSLEDSNEIDNCKDSNLTVTPECIRVPTSNCSSEKTSPPSQIRILLQPIKTSETGVNIGQMNGVVEYHDKVATVQRDPKIDSANKSADFQCDLKPKHLTESNSTKPCKKLSIDDSCLPNDCKLDISTQGSQDSKPHTTDFCLNQVLTNGASKDSGISSNSSTYADCALVPSQNVDMIGSGDSLTAEQVIQSFKNSPRPKKIDVNLQNDEDRPPHLFPMPPPYPPLASDQLFPSPPSLFLETKKDLTSKRFQDCCQSSPISIMRNIASVLKLDLGLFSTKTLVETNPDHLVEISSHLSYQSGDNLETSSTNQWACERHSSSSNISRYANYQVTSFRESLQEELESKTSGAKTSLVKESETDSNESASAQVKRLNTSSQSSSIQTNDTPGPNHASNSGSKGPVAKKIKKEQPRAKYVKLVERIDLSDDKKWRAQLNELNKLPNSIKCVSASNMLTHVGASMPGVNTISMGMHVPGCQILGNDAPNNFCSVNMNVGPGDYEWCAVSAEYCNILTRLCHKNGFDLNEKNWWPKMEDLKKYNVPIYRFSQRPGDLVWVNPGTIYWTRSIGWCNNICWNVGPLSARQYKLAAEKSEINKLVFFKSEVPMVQMTWNIVINISIIFEDELYSAIVDVLRRSLRYCVFVMDMVDESKQKLSLESVAPGPKLAKFCSACECEVFNIHFMRRFDNSIINCIECARRYDSTFVGYEIRQEYELNYLMKLHDNFIETKRKFQSHRK